MIPFLSPEDAAKYEAEQQERFRQEQATKKAERAQAAADALETYAQKVKVPIYSTPAAQEQFDTCIARRELPKKQLVMMTLEELRDPVATLHKLKAFK